MMLQMAEPLEQYSRHLYKYNRIFEAMAALQLFIDPPTYISSIGPLGTAMQLKWQLDSVNIKSS